jgi:hypothetical protein
MKCNNVLAACLMSVAEKKIYGLDNYEEDDYNDAKVGK